ncbi:MAG TPA: hypothetical protein VE521_05655 [Nitrososphaera sp.]|jgi:hypothetical protein|nr:hypothetical protein [Nitrososphaera sp.]
MKYDICAYIIYYVEPIGICHENLLLLLLLLSDVRAQEEEESTQFADEQIAVLRGVKVDGITVVPVASKEAAATALLSPPAQPCPQGRERQLTHCRLTRRKYTVRLTKTPSNNTKALQRDEEVSVKVKNRLLIRSRGLL